MTKLLLSLIILLTSILGVSQTEIDLKLFNMVNQYRLENKLNPLKWDTTLHKVAINQCEYMSKTGDLSSEQNENPTTDNNLTKNLKDKFINNGVYDNLWIGESIRVVYEPTKMSVDSICCLILNDWIKTPETNQMLLSDLYMNGAISHKKGDFNKELLGIDEFGDLVYSIIKCDMEWFSLDVSSRE